MLIRSKENEDATEAQLTGYSLDEIQYAIQVERTLRELEAQLHNVDDPETIAKNMLVAAAAFYDGDWCGIFDVDLTMKVWTPVWWYNRITGGMTPTTFMELEEGDYLPRWITSIQQGKPMVIEDVEKIKDAYPREYEVYQRLHARSLIAVPFWKRPTGFLLVRNPKRYIHRTSLLQMMAFVAVSSVNEKRLMDRTKMSLTPDVLLGCFTFMKNG